jgi:hypothetical protein
MQYEQNSNDRIKRNVLDAVRTCQAGVLDTLEMELGDSSNWKLIRSRLLRSFGDRGLAGRVIEILSFEFGGGVE